MACKVTLSLVSESQVGNIGDDWKYVLQAKVFNQGIAGEGKIKVRKHTLTSGTTQEPPGPPDPLVIPAGECGTEIKINLELVATEVDFLKNDSGTSSTSVTLTCPGQGGTPTSTETEMSVGVQESPGMVNETAIFTLNFRIVAECE